MTLNKLDQDGYPLQTSFNYKSLLSQIVSSGLLVDKSGQRDVSKEVATKYQHLIHPNMTRFLTLRGVVCQINSEVEAIKELKSSGFFFRKDFRFIGALTQLNDSGSVDSARLRETWSRREQVTATP